MVFVGITSGAMAATEYKNTNGDMCAKVDDNHVTIYFDTGSSTLIGEKIDCKDEYEKAIESVVGSENDIDQIVIIGSADNTGDGSSFDNTGLALRREQYAKGMLEGMNISVDDYITGSSDANAKERYGKQSEQRTAHIYVIWKQVECEQSDIDKIERMRNSLNDCKKCNDDISEQVKGIVNKMAEVCTDTGKKLTATPATEYKRLWQQLAKLIKDFDKKHPGVLDMRDFAEADYDYLKSLSLKQTVWRDEEGKFNVKRLASDSIAGVVLGTAGGLITSKLVKKNQIKTGFEDIQCTIGGQRVADWHDEFTVGIQ